ncbi:pilus assembly PilX family protein [Massilia suwonensis]|uniref:Tfp pilus assembly protein PilX n=1 Tax=Massilia suwonensis TaxID=648895 RepID=A0ABW0MKX9_9BURK
MTKPSTRQAGIALPVMLVILLVMLISSIYLLKSSNTTTLTASNLAYDAAQSHAVDHGLNEAFKWLAATSSSPASRSRLNTNQPGAGYVATYVPAEGVRNPDFWNGSAVVTVGGQRIQYVIHRMCLQQRAYNDDNVCVQTSANPFATGATLAPGSSMVVTTPNYNGVPRVHYQVTARMDGARGGNVVNQMMVLIGG